jgi:FAD:protein FMN transferase
MKEGKAYHNCFYAMGTRFHMVLPGMEHSRADHMYHVVKHEVNRVETTLSQFIPYSEISVINQHAQKEPVSVSEEVFSILQTCLYYHRITAGAFDITLRPLLQYWKNRHAVNESDMQMYKLLDDIGSDQIELNEKDQTVYLNNENLEIDLGGFGKGYALKKVSKIMQKFKVKNAFISFGESSILTMGVHPAGDYWKIGLNNYLNSGESVYTFCLNEGSVSTSSNFYVDDEGKLHHHRHIISPFTGYPLEDFATVSVRADSPELAEILSTAFLVLSDTVIEAIYPEIPDCEIVKINYGTGRPEIQIMKKNHVT